MKAFKLKFKLFNFEQLGYLSVILFFKILVKPGNGFYAVVEVLQWIVFIGGVDGIILKAKAH